MTEGQVYWIDAKDLSDADSKCQVRISDPAGFQVSYFTSRYAAVGSKDRDSHAILPAKTPNSSRQRVIMLHAERRFAGRQ